MATAVAETKSAHSVAPSGYAVNPDDPTKAMADTAENRKEYGVQDGFSLYWARDSTFGPWAKDPHGERERELQRCYPGAKTLKGPNGCDRITHGADLVAMQIPTELIERRRGETTSAQIDYLSDCSEDGVVDGEVSKTTEILPQYNKVQNRARHLAHIKAGLIGGATNHMNLADATALMEKVHGRGYTETLRTRHRNEQNSRKDMSLEAFQNHFRNQAGVRTFAMGDAGIGEPTLTKIQRAARDAKARGNK